MDKNLIMLEAKKELARREFFYFCHLSAPSFYKTDRKFLVRLCNEMQSFYESDEDALIINLPTRQEPYCVNVRRMGTRQKSK